MAGALVEDTPLGRDTIRNSFAWALGGMDQILKPGERYAMTLEKKDGRITFRYYKEQVQP